MATCSRPLLSRDRVRGEIIKAVSAGNLVDTFVPGPGNASISKTDIASADYSSQASCTLTWDSAEIALDINLTKELIAAIDSASAVIGQIGAQSTSILEAVRKVVDVLIGLQRVNERSLELTWDFKVDVAKDTAFLVKHSQVIAWKATKIGPLKGTGRVIARHSVILPDGTTKELNVTANHDTNATQQQFSNNACHVTYLSPGQRTSNVRTVLKVMLPSIADQLGELVKDLLETIQKLTASLSKGFEELKKAIENALQPDFFTPNLPQNEASAVDLLKQAINKFLTMLKRLAGEVSGQISVEHSSLSFQAITDAFHDTWLKPDTDESSIAPSGEEEEPAEPDGDSGTGTSVLPEGATPVGSPELDLPDSRHEYIPLDADTLMIYDNIRPGMSEVSLSIYRYRELMDRPEAPET